MSEPRNKMVVIPYLLGLIPIALIVAALTLAFLSWAGDVSAAESKLGKHKVGHKKIAIKKGDKKPPQSVHTAKSRNRARAEIKRAKKQPPGIQAKAYYCVSIRGNRTIMARNEDQQLPVASLTKLVTALVAVENMPIDSKVTVPDQIKTVPKSVVGLKPGDQVTVADLLHGLLIGSGNDCAETLAHNFPGGREKFIEATNKKVRAMGMQSTIFYTPSGLDRKTETTREGKKTLDVDSNVSTAREIAQIARVAFGNNAIREICAKRTHLIASSLEPNGYHVKNTNKLLRDDLPIVGGKTGFTLRAGHCLATEFTPGRNVLLIVVLGSPDHFRDTRLVYRQALKEVHKIELPPRRSHPRELASKMN